MKKLWKKVTQWVSRMLGKIDDVVDKLLPVATNIVQAVKKTVEHEKFDTVVSIVKFYAPTTVDLVIDEVVESVEKIIPKLALQLEIIQSIADTEDKQEQVNAVLEALKEATDDQWQKYWATFAQELTHVLADGKVTWGEAGSLAEYHFKNYIQKQ